MSKHGKTVEDHDKVVGYWKACAIAVQEQDVKTLMRCAFALKSLEKRVNMPGRFSSFDHFSQPSELSEGVIE